MPKVTIYHNPRCSKSRQTLALLEERGIAPAIIEYLETPPTEKELTQIIKMLNITPIGLIRRGEAIYKELALDNPNLTDKQLIQMMIQHPILIERPIVVIGNKAVIGRPPENVLAILD